MSSQPEEQSSRSCLEALLRITLQTCRCLEDSSCVKRVPEAAWAGRLQREKSSEEAGCEKGLEKRFFSYSNCKGGQSLETRIAAFFTRSGSKLNLRMGKAACTAGAGGREEELASKYISKCIFLLEEWDCQRELKAQVPPQQVGLVAATRRPPAPCPVQGGWTSSLGCGSRCRRGAQTGRKGESLGTCWATDWWSSLCCFSWGKVHTCPRRL